MVELALNRVKYAAAVFGPIEVHGHSEMSPAWRELLKALAEVIPVVWIAGPRYVPSWLTATKIEDPPNQTGYPRANAVLVRQSSS